MRYLVLGLISTMLVVGWPSGLAEAQTWTARGGLDLTGGVQTNPYLDPALGIWDLQTDPAVLAATPRLGLSRTGGALSLHAGSRVRLNPLRSRSPQLVQARASARYRLDEVWTASLALGGRHTRLSSSESSGWLLPSITWSVTSSTSLSAVAGGTGRLAFASSPTERQASSLVVLRARTWLTGRMRGSVQAYRSTGSTQVADITLAGTGLRLGATYWPTDALALNGTAAVERLRYEGATAEDTDHLMHVRGEVRWTAGAHITVFAQAGVLNASLSTGSRVDVHGAAGLRLRVQRVLRSRDARPAPAPREPGLCRATDTGLQLRVPYADEGTVYVTGSFNGWALPGIELEPTDSGTWAGSLPLPAGRYTYRIRVVDNGNGRWLNLPPGTQTEDDDFGGTNGVCIVY